MRLTAAISPRMHQRPFCLSNVADGMSWASFAPSAGPAERPFAAFAGPSVSEGDDPFGEEEEPSAPGFAAFAAGEGDEPFGEEEEEEQQQAFALPAQGQAGQAVAPAVPGQAEGQAITLVACKAWAKDLVARFRSSDSSLKLPFLQLCDFASKVPDNFQNRFFDWSLGKLHLSSQSLGLTHHIKSDAAVASDTGQSRHAVLSLRTRLAAGCFFGMRSFADSLVGSLCAAVRAAGGKPLVFYECHRGDETPFSKISVSSGDLAEPSAPAIRFDPSRQGGDAATPAVHQQGGPVEAHRHRYVQSCKIFQPEIKVGCLFQRASGDFLLLTLDLPTALQAHSSGDGQTCCASAHRLSSCLSSSREFVRSQRLATADGANSMVQAERVVSKRQAASGNFPVSSLSMWCLIHRIYKVVEHPSERCSSCITGAIRFSLSLRGPGNFASFFKAAKWWLTTHLDYRRGQGGPSRDATLHREATYKLLLPRTGKSGREHHLRAYIISSLANGDIRQANTFQHYCRAGCCESKADCIAKLTRFFLPALFGTLPPLFLRGRWTKNDKVWNWIGLAESIHGLLSAVYRQWVGRALGNKMPSLHGDLCECLGMDLAASAKVALQGASGNDAAPDVEAQCLPSNAFCCFKHFRMTL